MTPKRRRAKGEGSFVQRPDGSWLYAIDLGVNAATGKRQRRFFYAKTRAELTRKIADLKAENGGSIRQRARGTVSSWMSQWLEEDVRPNLSRNTYALYESMWRVHAEPVIGSLSLERLTPEIVAGLYDRLRQKKASATVIHRVGVTMQRAIAVATRRGIFHRANPFELVDRPTPRPKEMHEMTIDEARRFIAAARQDRLAALFILLVTSGLRLGEALGLQWQDIDFEKRRIAIRRSLTEVGGVVQLGSTKTRGSRRSVEIGAVAMGALSKHHVAQQGQGSSSELVFTTAIGTPLRRSNLRRSHFEPILKRAGIKSLTIHGLRHAMTSFGIASGVAPKILAERLGHSTTRLTQDRYAHVLPGLQRDAADAIDEMLR